MQRRSAGLLVYRRQRKALELLLAHPGGPYFSKKDLGVWSIPKGEYPDDEEPLTAAKREFREETGFDIDGEFLELSPIIQKGGKKALAWAIEKDLDPAGFESNLFTMEWPYKSGRFKEFPEVDKLQWFSLEQAREKINPSQ